MNHRCWKLSAYDLAFLWDECPRCFYLKHVRGVTRPPHLVPAAHNHLDAPASPRACGSHPAELAAANVPAAWRGLVAYEERWVQSDPLTLPGRESTVILRGRFDAAIQLDDGSFGLLALAASSPDIPETIRRYSRYLHDCALAAEFAGPRSLRLDKVSRLGLLALDPSDSTRDNTSGALGSASRWIDIPRDDAAFLQFLDAIIAVLEHPAPPAPSQTCDYCADQTARQRVGV